MSELSADTLHALRRLALGAMGAAELAEWLAVRLPDLWDSGRQADRYLLSELSLALEQVDKGRAGIESLRQRAIALAEESEIRGINAPSDVRVTAFVGTANTNIVTTTTSGQLTESLLQEAVA